MKSFIEILHEKFNTLDEKNRNEILSITLKEIEFFSRMVNDLLFLAQVNEPKYKDRNDDVDLVYLISEECYELEFRESQREKSVKIKTVFPTNPSLIHGDRHLLQRLFRNALENAISFARTEVLVCIEVRDPQLAESDSAEHSINNKPPAKTEVSNKLIRISIEDDGPGFSAEALSRFGIKRFQRNTQTDQHSKRISVGLGSVIMASICQIHNGRLSVQNRIDSTEKIMGSKIQIEFGPGFIEPT